jgi:hypothetical protein
MMSTYAIDCITGAQAEAPAITVVRPSTPPKAHHTRTTGNNTKTGLVTNKGKGKAVAAVTPILTDLDLELASNGKHYLCYRGDKHQACTACIKADIPCVNTLNLQYDRLVCQSCKKHKSQCNASQDSHTIAVKGEPSLQKIESSTPRSSHKRTIEQMGKSFSNAGGITC